MTDTNEDRELRARFARMREDDRARAPAPDFESMVGRARSERSRPMAVRPKRRHGGLIRATGWVAVGAAATVAGLVVTNRARPGSEFDRVVVGYSAEVALGIWDSPTSGLLRVPGSDLLGSMPTLGPGALPDLSIDSGEDGR